LRFLGIFFLSFYLLFSSETVPVKVKLEFSLEQPMGGVAFVVPSTGSDPMVSVAVNKSF